MNAARGDWIDREPSLCLSNLVLDRLRVGELSASSPEQQHLGSCARCRARSAGLADDAGDFDASFFLPALAQTTQKRANKPLAVVAGATALAASFGLAFLLPARDQEGTEVRRKGGFALTVVAKADDGRVEAVIPGQPLSPGHAIRFILDTEEEGYVAIVGIDSAKAVTPYAPLTGTASALHRGIDQALDGSIELDETLGDERIVAVLCKEPIAIDAVVGAAKRALHEAGEPKLVASLPLDCKQSSVWIRKVERP